MTTTTETNERREEEEEEEEGAFDGEGVVVQTAHDVVALAHCVAALVFSKKNRGVQIDNNNFIEEIRIE